MKKCPKTFTVLLVGPSPSATGGMATVGSQHLALTRPECRVRFQAVTVSPRHCESAFGKLSRHIAHTINLWRAIRNDRIEIVHLHTCSGPSFWRSAIDAVVANASGCKTILHVHGGGFEQFARGAHRIKRWTISRVLSRADCVIALSNGWREKIRQIAPPAQISVIENGVEIPTNVKARAPGKTCRFLLLGSMEPWKGVDDALQACRILMGRGLDFHLTLAGPPGSAGDANTLSAKFRKLGLSQNISYLGPVDGAAKQQFFENCDALLLPSWYEGMPIVILEALAFGLPVIATSVGAIPEIITDGVEGLLVPPRDTSAIASAMARLAGDSDLRLQMGRAGRDVAEHRFPLSRFHDDLLALYTKLLDNHVAMPLLSRSAEALGLTC